MLDSPKAVSMLDFANGVKYAFRRLVEMALAFAIMRATATTLNESAGDLFSQILKLGYFLTAGGVFRAVSGYAHGPAQVEGLQADFLLGRDSFNRYDWNDDLGFHEPAQEFPAPQAGEEFAGLIPAWPGIHELVMRRRCSAVSIPARSPASFILD